MNRLIAPFVITIIVVIIFIGYLIACSMCPLPLWGKITGVVGSLGLIYVAVSVLIERIKEVRSKEEDDLSKY